MLTVDVLVPLSVLSCNCTWPQLTRPLSRNFASTNSRSTLRPSYSIASTATPMHDPSISVQMNSFLFGPHRSDSVVVCLSICLSVCLSVTFVSCAKTAELFEMPFGFWDEDSGRPKEQCIRWDGVQISHIKGQF